MTLSAAARRRILAAVSWLLLAASIGYIGREIHLAGWQPIRDSLLSLPGGRLAGALLLTPAAYLLLTGYDQIAFRYIGRRLPLRRVVFAAFLGYAYSNSISMTPSMAVRFRLYSKWGVPPAEIAKVIFFHYVSTWLGFLSVGGLILLLEPGPIARAPVLALGQRQWIGAALLLALGLYLGLSARGGIELRIRSHALPFPRPRIVVPQTLLAAADWALMGAIPFLLLPTREPIGYVGFVSVFLLANIAQILSHVPGGVGVFEGAMLLLLKPYAPASSILAALLAYRVVFMLLPLGVASLLLLAYEVRSGRPERAARPAARLPRRAACFLKLSAQGREARSSGKEPAMARNARETQATRTESAGGKDRLEQEMIDPSKDEFARRESYDSGIVTPAKDEILDQHAREGYEQSSSHTVGPVRGVIGAGPQARAGIAEGREPPAAAPTQPLEAPPALRAQETAAKRPIERERAELEKERDHPVIEPAGNNPGSGGAFSSEGGLTDATPATGSSPTSGSATGGTLHGSGSPATDEEEAA